MYRLFRTRIFARLVDRVGGPVHAATFAGALAFVSSISFIAVVVHEESALAQSRPALEEAVPGHPSLEAHPVLQAPAPNRPASPASTANRAAVEAPATNHPAWQAPAA